MNDLLAANNRTVLLPVGWQSNTASELAGRPQEIINKKTLENCDLLIKFRDYAAGFVEKFRRQLQIVLGDSIFLRELTAASSLDADNVPETKPIALVDEAKLLLLEAAQGDGEILQFDALGRKRIQANKRNSAFHGNAVQPRNWKQP